MGLMAEQETRSAIVPRRGIMLEAPLLSTVTQNKRNTSASEAIEQSKNSQKIDKAR